MFSCMIAYINAQGKKLGKTFTGPTHELLFSSTAMSDVYRSFIPNKTTFTKDCLIQWISKLPVKFEIDWIRPSVPGKFHGPDGHSKRNCLQDWANFHSFRAWQIFLFFYIVLKLEAKILLSHETMLISISCIRLKSKWNAQCGTKGAPKLNRHEILPKWRSHNDYRESLLDSHVQK